MKVDLPLKNEQKLAVLFRLEPGCLGPDGVNVCHDFCAFAEKSVASLDGDFIIWSIQPRLDKALPEIEYHLANKRLTHDQAARYLELLGKQLDEFEGHLDEILGQLIDQYFER